MLPSKFLETILAPLGRFWAPFGRFWARFGPQLGAKGLPKSTFLAPSRTKNSKNESQNETSKNAWKFDRNLMKKNEILNVLKPQNYYVQRHSGDWRILWGNQKNDEKMMPEGSQKNIQKTTLERSRRKRMTSSILGPSTMKSGKSLMLKYDFSFGKCRSEGPFCPPRKNPKVLQNRSFDSSLGPLIKIIVLSQNIFVNVK